jgi:hypothetical protein
MIEVCLLFLDDFGGVLFFLLVDLVDVDPESGGFL